jgi:hypothetical protein
MKLDWIKCIFCFINFFVYDIFWCTVCCCQYNTWHHHIIIEAHTKSMFDSTYWFVTCVLWHDICQACLKVQYNKSLSINGSLGFGESNMDAKWATHIFGESSMDARWATRYVTSHVLIQDQLQVYIRSKALTHDYLQLYLRSKPL